MINNIYSFFFPKPPNSVSDLHKEQQYKTDILQKYKLVLDELVVRFQSLPTDNPSDLTYIPEYSLDYNILDQTTNQILENEITESLEEESLEEEIVEEIVEEEIVEEEMVETDKENNGIDIVKGDGENEIIDKSIYDMVDNSDGWDDWEIVPEVSENGESFMVDQGGDGWNYSPVLESGKDEDGGVKKDVEILNELSVYLRDMIKETDKEVKRKIVERMYEYLIVNKRFVDENEYFAKAIKNRMLKSAIHDNIFYKEYYSILFDANIYEDLKSFDDLY